MPFWTPEVVWVNLRKSSEKLPKAVAQSGKGKVDPKLSVWASKYFIQTGPMPFWTPEVVWLNLRKSSEKLPKAVAQSGKGKAVPKLSVWASKYPLYVLFHALVPKLHESRLLLDWA